MFRKVLEYTLYGLTILYGFLIAGTGMGDTSNVGYYLAQRGGFYIAEAVFLVIDMIRCSRLYSKYDYNYFKVTEKLFVAADCCFMMIVIITVFSIAGMIPIFVFLPQNVFEKGAANGLFVSLLIVALIFVLHLIAGKRFDLVRRKVGEINHPLSQRTEDFYAFIHFPDRKEKPVNYEMPAALLDDFIPSPEDFQQHMRKISDLKPPQSPQPEQLWECPYCGSTNPIHSEQCDFCGANRDNKLPQQRKEDTDAGN